jgi:hypothetical protein
MYKTFVFVFACNYGHICGKIDEGPNSNHGPLNADYDIYTIIELRRLTIRQIVKSKLRKCRLQIAELRLRKCHPQIAELRFRSRGKSTHRRIYVG